MKINKFVSDKITFIVDFVGGFDYLGGYDFNYNYLLN